jgi:hypothetical protein
MGILKNLFGGTPAKPEKRYYTFNVKCNRCGEIIEGRVDLDRAARCASAATPAA